MNILTDEEIFKCLPAEESNMEFARAIEAAVLLHLASVWNPYAKYEETIESMRRQLAMVKRLDFSEMREMLRAMQAGELTVSRGVEILEMWSAGNWNDGMLPPVRQDLIEEDSMPVEIIDRLRQQLTEARQEIADRKADCETGHDQDEKTIAELRHQLAASQAREQQLRAALKELVALKRMKERIEVSDSCSEHDYLWQDYQTRKHRAWSTASEAITMPQDTSALEAMIAKAGEVMRERCAQSGMLVANNGIETAGAIRALPAVTLDDLKGGA